MNVYETIIISDASLDDEAIEASIQKIKDIITGGGGEVLKTDPWGRRRLAYAINKHQRGFYTLLLHQAPPETIKKLEDFFKVHDPVVKSMTVKLERKQREATLRALAESQKAEEAPAEEPAPAETSPSEAPVEAPAAETPATGAPEEKAAEGSPEAEEK